MELLFFLLRREVIIATAIVGAMIALIGTVLTGRKASAPPRLARGVMRLGYSDHLMSIALFLGAGFLSGR